jgi:autotransporter-associated beta strand protein
MAERAAGARGGLTIFFGGNPGNASLIALGGTDGGEGGSILFESASDPGTARVELFGNGSLGIVGAARAVQVGSIEGDGDIFLGGSRLTVGQNNLDTIFSGLITGARDNRGSLTKKGTGTLVLTNANTYTGGTTISGGWLVMNNSDGSATGTGAVRVNAGISAGRGTIAGEVIVGTGSGAGAALAPGRRRSKTDTLTILSADVPARLGLQIRVKR